MTPNFNEAAERLAKFIAQRESIKCKTLDEALYHQSKWERILPEALEMLQAAFPLGASPIPAAQEWIDVKEKLPRPQEFVLAYYAPDDMEVTWHTGEVWSYMQPGAPTHWRPLPAAPPSIKP